MVTSNTNDPPMQSALLSTPLRNTACNSHEEPMQHVVSFLEPKDITAILFFFLRGDITVILVARPSESDSSSRN